MPEINEALKDSPTKFFGTVRPKSLDGKTWYPPFFFIKLFETKNFLKNSRIPLRKFSALLDLKMSTENGDARPLIHKFFSIPENFGKQKGSFTKLFVSVLWDKNFDKTVMPPPSPSYAWKFSIEEFFWNTKLFSNEIFRYSETKTSTENRNPPHALLSIKYFSLPEIFWNTEWFPGEVFSVLWDKENFDKTVKLPPSSAWNFSIPEFFRKTEGFSYEYSRHWETKIFRRKIVIPFCIKYRNQWWNWCL